MVLLLCVFLLLTVLLFFYKYSLTAMTNKKLGQNLRHKWIYWHGKNAVAGAPHTPSDWYRQYLKKSNRISFLMWACLAISIAIMIVIRFYK